jgi:signal transduction histidine kinase
MRPVHGESRRGATSAAPVDARSYVSAILNILEDVEEEKTQLASAQRAVINILDDVASDRFRIQATQRAVLNVLEDASEERIRLADTQRAIVNILDDSAEEQLRLAATQRAVLNILDDAASERTQLQATQRAILNILDDSADEKARLADTQRAAVNILDDFNLEKTKVVQVNADLRSEIAERVRVEEALRQANTVAEAASQELEAFSYSVAHDLRAPLRSIDGFSQAILEDCADRLDSDGTTYLNHVREAASQMGTLIDDLLNLARVTRAELRREHVDVSRIARHVLSRLRESQPGRAVDVVVEDGLFAWADPRLVDVVLVNLLSNAWKFTAKRTFTRIQFGATGEAPAVFLVRDNGAGFNPAYAEKLFGVFQRLHDAQEFEGTGIGLATVQRIIHRHGGWIRAEGEVDHGATFFFTLEENDKG